MEQAGGRSAPGEAGGLHLASFRVTPCSRKTALGGSRPGRAGSRCPGDVRQRCGGEVVLQRRERDVDHPQVQDDQKLSRRHHRQHCPPPPARLRLFSLRRIVMPGVSRHDRVTAHGGRLLIRGGGNELRSAAARWRPARRRRRRAGRIPQAARRRGSPRRRRVASCRQAREQRQPVRHGANAVPATRGCRCLAGPGRSPIRPCRTSRPGSAPTRGSRRVIPVAQLADGISQLGMSPAHLVGDAAVGKGHSQVARVIDRPGHRPGPKGQSVTPTSRCPRPTFWCRAGLAVPPVAQPA